MQALHSFEVNPKLPKELEFLRELAYNIWVFWNFDAFDLFRRLDRDLWEEVHHNPVLMLGKVSQDMLEMRATDEGYLSQLDRVKSEYERYMSSRKELTLNGKKVKDILVAYFSMEYGLCEALPLYSGGLGVLSGDHIKSSSDLNLPMVGLGLLYDRGYLRQYLNSEGWQQEFYENNDFYNMPLTLVKDKEGQLVKIWVPMNDHKVHAQIWKIQVGRTELYMLDTNLPENSEEDKKITYQLYAGDREFRLKQEILIGIGGIRALKALDIQPTAYHFNEGHCAFGALERIRLIQEEYKMSFHEAFEAVYASSSFTTHTPVPAGNDRFSPQLMEKYFTEYLKELNISFEKFMELGRENPSHKSEEFCMTVLAIKCAAYCNGVSELHSRVSRDMWKNLFMKLPAEDVPIIHITNGVHIPSFISQDMSELFNRYLGPRWKEDPDNKKVWERVQNIPSSELWRTHERRRERMVSFIRKRMNEQLKRRGASQSELKDVQDILNPKALTIGFARRFATYKRAALLFRDPERLKKILTNEQYPIQIVFAGKAHPQDMEGKEVIKKIVQYAKEESFRNQIVFIEDYDINVARYMVQGVDIWLNTPRRPLEASGTSGMKATANGSLNVSILDGWWCEGYDPDWGWAIGNGEEYDDLEYQDDLESRALYDILEKEVAPLFYDMGRDGLPGKWIEMMRLSMQKICHMFNSNRMLEEYTHKFYIPSSQIWKRFSKDDFCWSKEASIWKERVVKNWDKIQIKKVITEVEDPVTVGSEYPIKVHLRLGKGLNPDDIKVQAYYGPLNIHNEFKSNQIADLDFDEYKSDEGYIFSGKIKCLTSGKMGYAIRIIPHHPEIVNPFILNAVHWG